ncbi:Prolyl-tRNA editing protein ProX [Mizuhopecten yessoensis]|uniref:PrdX deacylase domain-containing protein 1 n=1 Tax=Mizuhopecten yessoensis TaxID=6573 RepID=A0A210QPU1_MIZYE|nr:Prolyl-tRNA editing protein ProX [Mizuhopecten yessoensis]
MAAHEKGAREGARGFGLGEVAGVFFFLSYLFPSLHFQIFKTIRDSKNQILMTQKNTYTPKITSESKSAPCPKISQLPTDLNKKSLQLFETFSELSISTESVKYLPKEHRDPNDATIYCKNLFLKDRKGRFYLVICLEDEVVDLKSLRQKLKAYRNFSFASATEVSCILGVCPGEVTPLALPQDTDGKVTVAVMQSICTQEKLLNFHPLDKRYATRMSFIDLQRFLTNCGHTLEKLTP